MTIAKLAPDTATRCVSDNTFIWSDISGDSIVLTPIERPATRALESGVTRAS